MALRFPFQIPSATNTVLQTTKHVCLRFRSMSADKCGQSLSIQSSRPSLPEFVPRRSHSIPIYPDLLCRAQQVKFSSRTDGREAEEEVDEESEIPPMKMVPNINKGGRPYNVVELHKRIYYERYVTRSHLQPNNLRPFGANDNPVLQPSKFTKQSIKYPMSHKFQSAKRTMSSQSMKMDCERGSSMAQRRGLCTGSKKNPPDARIAMKKADLSLDYKKINPGYLMPQKITKIIPQRNDDFDMYRDDFIENYEEECKSTSSSVTDVEKCNRLIADFKKVNPECTIKKKEIPLNNAEEKEALNNAIKFVERYKQRYPQVEEGDELFDEEEKRVRPAVIHEKTTPRKKFSFGPEEKHELTVSRATELKLVKGPKINLLQSSAFPEESQLQDNIHVRDDERLISPWPSYSETIKSSNDLMNESLMENSEKLCGMFPVDVQNRNLTTVTNTTPVETAARPILVQNIDDIHTNSPNSQISTSVPIEQLSEQTQDKSHKVTYVANKLKSTPLRNKYVSAFNITHEIPGSICNPKNYCAWRTMCSRKFSNCKKPTFGCGGDDDEPPKPCKCKPAPPPSCEEECDPCDTSCDLNLASDEYTKMVPLKRLKKRKGYEEKEKQWSEEDCPLPCQTPRADDIAGYKVEEKQLPVLTPKCQKVCIEQTYKCPILRRLPKCELPEKSKERVDDCVCVPLERADDGMKVEPKCLPQLHPGNCQPVVVCEDLKMPKIKRLPPQIEMEPLRTCPQDPCLEKNRRADEGMGVERKCLPKLEEGECQPVIEDIKYVCPKLRRLPKVKFIDPPRVCPIFECPERADECEVVEKKTLPVLKPKECVCKVCLFSTSTKPKTLNYYEPKRMYRRNHARSVNPRHADKTGDEQFYKPNEQRNQQLLLKKERLNNAWLPLKDIPEYTDNLELSTESAQCSRVFDCPHAQDIQPLNSSKILPSTLTDIPPCQSTTVNKKRSSSIPPMSIIPQNGSGGQFSTLGRIKNSDKVFSTYFAQCNTFSTKSSTKRKSKKKKCPAVKLCDCPERTTFLCDYPNYPNNSSRIDPPFMSYSECMEICPEIPPCGECLEDELQPRNCIFGKNPKVEPLPNDQIEIELGKEESCVMGLMGMKRVDYAHCDSVAPKKKFYRAKDYLDATHVRVSCKLPPSKVVVKMGNKESDKCEDVLTEGVSDYVVEKKDSCRTTRESGILAKRRLREAKARMKMIEEKRKKNVNVEINIGESKKKVPLKCPETQQCIEKHISSILTSKRAQQQSNNTTTKEVECINKTKKEETEKSIVKYITVPNEGIIETAAPPAVQATVQELVNMYQQQCAETNLVFKVQEEVVNNFIRPTFEYLCSRCPPQQGDDCVKGPPKPLEEKTCENDPCDKDKDSEQNDKKPPQKKASEENPKKASEAKKKEESRDNADCETDDKSKSKSAAGKTDGKVADGKTAGKSAAGKTDDKAADCKTDSKSDGKSEGKSAAGKSVGKPESKSAADKSAVGKAGEKPADGKPGEKNDCATNPREAIKIGLEEMKKCIQYHVSLITKTKEATKEEKSEPGKKAEGKETDKKTETKEAKATPKEAPKAAKEAPKAAKEAPKTAKEAPKAAKDAKEAKPADPKKEAKDSKAVDPKKETKDAKATDDCDEKDSGKEGVKKVEAASEKGSEKEIANKKQEEKEESKPAKSESKSDPCQEIPDEIKCSKYCGVDDLKVDPEECKDSKTKSASEKDKDQNKEDKKAADKDKKSDAAKKAASADSGEKSEKPDKDAAQKGDECQEDPDAIKCSKYCGVDDLNDPPPKKEPAKTSAKSAAKPKEEAAASKDKKDAAKKPDEECNGNDKPKTEETKKAKEDAAKKAKPEPKTASKKDSVKDQKGLAAGRDKKDAAAGDDCQEPKPKEDKKAAAKDKKADAVQKAPSSPKKEDPSKKPKEEAKSAKKPDSGEKGKEKLAAGKDKDKKKTADAAAGGDDCQEPKPKDDKKAAAKDKKAAEKAPSSPKKEEPSKKPKEEPKSAKKPDSGEKGKQQLAAGKDNDKKQTDAGAGDDECQESKPKDDKKAAAKDKKADAASSTKKVVKEDAGKKPKEEAKSAKSKEEPKIAKTAANATEKDDCQESEPKEDKKAADKDKKSDATKKAASADSGEKSGKPDKDAAQKGDECQEDPDAIKCSKYCGVDDLNDPPPKKDDATKKDAAAKKDDATKKDAAAKKDDATKKDAAAKKDDATKKDAAAKEDDATKKGDKTDAAKKGDAICQEDPDAIKCSKYCGVDDLKDAKKDCESESKKAADAAAGGDDCQEPKPKDDKKAAAKDKKATEKAPSSPKKEEPKKEAKTPQKVDASKEDQDAMKCEDDSKKETEKQQAAKAEEKPPKKEPDQKVKEPIKKTLPKKEADTKTEPKKVNSTLGFFRGKDKKDKEDKAPPKKAKSTGFLKGLAKPDKAKDAKAKEECDPKLKMSAAKKNTCKPNKAVCQKPKSIWQMIVEYFKARPNCPTPEELRKKRLREQAEKAARAAGLCVCECPPDPCEAARRVNEEPRKAKQDPCKREDPCKKIIADDPCKEIIATDPCKPIIAEDPCKNIFAADPCKKMVVATDPCKVEAPKEMKVDLCGNVQDICAAFGRREKKTQRLPKLKDLPPKPQEKKKATDSFKEINDICKTLGQEEDVSKKEDPCGGAIVVGRKSRSKTKLSSEKKPPLKIFGKIKGIMNKKDSESVPVEKQKKKVAHKVEDPCVVVPFVDPCAADPCAADPCVGDPCKKLEDFSEKKESKKHDDPCAAFEEQIKAHEALECKVEEVKIVDDNAAGALAIEAADAGSEITQLEKNLCRVITDITRMEKDVAKEEKQLFAKQEKIWETEEYLCKKVQELSGVEKAIFEKENELRSKIAELSKEGARLDKLPGFIDDGTTKASIKESESDAREALDSACQSTSNACSASKKENERNIAKLKNSNRCGDDKKSYSTFARSMDESSSKKGCKQKKLDDCPPTDKPACSGQTPSPSCCYRFYEAPYQLTRFRQTSHGKKFGDGKRNYSTSALQQSSRGYSTRVRSKKSQPLVRRMNKEQLVKKILTAIEAAVENRDAAGVCKVCISDLCHRLESLCHDGWGIDYKIHTTTGYFPSRENLMDAIIELWNLSSSCYGTHDDLLKTADDYEDIERKKTEEVLRQLEYLLKLKDDKFED